MRCKPKYLLKIRKHFFFFFENTSLHKLKATQGILLLNLVTNDLILLDKIFSHIVG